MRVIDHTRKRPARVRRLNALTIALGVVVVMGGLGFLSTKEVFRPDRPHVKSSSTDVDEPDPAAPAETDAIKAGSLKIFTADEFKSLANTIGYPNNHLLDTPPDITGNGAADLRIRQLAEQRGYRLRSVPITPLEKADKDGTLLQPKAVAPWQSLVGEARAAGVHFSIMSGYRSVEEQRELFTSRLLSSGVTVGKIAAGHGDGAVVAALGLTAPPGYSRHHTGFTLDIKCDDNPSASFLDTSCFKWLSSNNYQHVKQFGWIPSYPPGITKQGPEPEPWEYVWVGLNAVSGGS